mgnify:CR=1 FL=1
MFSIKRNRNTHAGHFGEMASWQMRGVNFDGLRARQDELLARQRTEEEKEKEKKRRREREVANKESGKRHRDMLQRVAEIATVPRASHHLQKMRMRTIEFPRAIYTKRVIPDHPTATG